MLADGAEGGGADSSLKTIQGESSDASAGLVEIFYTNGYVRFVYNCCILMNAQYFHASNIYIYNSM